MNKIKQKILITRIRKGDQKAFEEIYKILADKIYRFLFFRIPDEQTSQDMLQEVFLKTWNYISQPKNKIENLQALIFRIAKNSIADYYRSNKIEQIDIEEIAYKIEDKKSGQVETEIDIKINIKEINQKLSKLKNPLYKEIIELRFLNELSYKEIAQILDKSEKNVSVMLHRAMKELKKLFDKSN